jgi:Lrp/AsnC family transcriptional regulator for asnA, asnC and gidA
MSLDEIDRKIIKILQQDARTPFTEVGRELEISDATVHVRVKRMLNDDIIKCYTLIVDDEVLGKKMSGFVLLNVAPGSLEGVIAHLLEMEHVDEIYEIHGPNDLIVKLWGGDLDEMREYLLKIREIPNITSSELITIYKVWQAQIY